MTAIFKYNTDKIKIMKKIIINFLLFVVILHAVSAETKIFSGTVITDSEKIADGYKFSFEYDESSKKAFATTPSTNMIIDYGACKSNNIFRICINSANFSHRNITTYKSYYELKVDIYKLTGSLSATMEATSTKLIQQEQTNVTITITNPTNLDVTDIDLSFDQSNFSVIEAKGCTLSGGKVSWKGSLKPNYDKECIVVMAAPQKDGTYTISGKLSYLNGFDKETKTLDSLPITVLPKQLKFIGIISNDTDFSRLEVGDSFHLNASIQNINDLENLYVKAAVSIPSNAILLKDLQFFDKNGGMLERNFVLKPRQFFNYSIYLKATVNGSGRLVNSFDYEIKNLRESIENLTMVESTEPKPIADIIPEYNAIVPGQKFIIVAKLSNPSRKYSFTQITSRLDVPFSDEIVQKLDRLAPNQSYVMISKVFLLPMDAELQGEELKITMNTEYTLGEVSKLINASVDIAVNRTLNSNSAPESPDLNEVAKKNPEFNEAQQQASTEPEADSAKPAEAQAPLEIKDSIDSAKTDFSSPKIWIILASIFALIFVVPALIYSARKKKPAQPPLNPPRI